MVMAQPPLKRIQVGFISIARPQFDTVYASSVMKDSIEGIKAQGFDVIAFGRLVMDEKDARAAKEWVQEVNPGVLVVQQGTFADASLILTISDGLKVPLLLWALREPSVKSGRLRLNSLCGLNLAAHALTGAGRPFDHAYGDPNDKTMQRIGRFIRAGSVMAGLREANMLVVGAAPKGYYPSEFDPLYLRSIWGLNVLRVPLNEVFARASAVSPDEVMKIRRDLECRLPNIGEIAPDAVDKSIRAYLALSGLLCETNSIACAIECWPDFMAKFGGAVCFAVGKLTEDGFPTACEADVYGALTMLLQQRLVGSPPYLGDLVHVNDANGSLVFWHCGAGAPCLASPVEGMRAGVHPNRKVGLTLEFSLRSGPVTIARLGKSPDGNYRMFIAQGEAIESPLWFQGTSMEVRLEISPETALDSLIGQGFEHHYSIVYGDVAEELGSMCRMKEVRVARV